MTDDFVDKLILTTLAFWARQVRRGGCTREQELAILDAISTNGKVLATVEEIAEFYGKSKEDVYGVIKRKYIGRPKRNIAMYSFSQFAQIAPKSWNAGIGLVIDDKTES